MRDLRKELKFSDKMVLREKLGAILDVMDARIYKRLVMTEFELKVDEGKASKLLEIMRA